MLIKNHLERKGFEIQKEKKKLYNWYRLKNYRKENRKKKKRKRTPFSLFCRLLLFSSFFHFFFHCQKTHTIMFVEVKQSFEKFFPTKPQQPKLIYWLGQHSHRQTMNLRARVAFSTDDTNVKTTSFTFLLKYSPLWAAACPCLHAHHM